ncbi:MAG: hypothetical protein PWQ91_348 [Eubacteriales bacterium]|nr:hypothetical protein [Eubacteriales bacterium]
MVQMAINRALATFKKNWIFLILFVTGAIIFSTLVEFPVVLLGRFDDTAFLGLIFFPAVFIITSFVSFMQFDIFLAAARGEELNLATSFARVKKVYPTMLLATIIIGVAVIIGGFFLIIPGIYLFYRLRFSPYFILEYKCAATESLRLSWEATAGHLLDIFLLDAFSLVIALLGVLALYVGLIPASVYLLLVQAHFYRLLIEEREAFVLAGEGQ